MGHLVILLSSALLVLCQGFSPKTRLHCCSLGTNYSSNGQSCKTFQTPVPGVPTEDERICLSVIDICCKKQLRVLQCDSGEKAAKLGSCPLEDGDKKECCQACQIGIEFKKAGEPCVDTLGFGYPITEAFVSCCEEANIEKSSVLTTPRNDPKSSAEGTKYSKLTDDTPFYPGLSEENVCETGEYCAQLCEPSGKSYKCSCFRGYELMKDGVSCKPIKQAKGSRCEKDNPCDHDCTDTGTSIECSCSTGYELGDDKRSCKDIDECALGIHECKPEEECENSEGTYFCFVTEFEPDDDYANKCPIGHKFNADKSVCDDVNECEFDLICPPPRVCKNTIGSYSCEGPDCPPGFYYKASIEVCADIDECITGDNHCNKDTEICLNTKGNYTCVDKNSRKACPPGFKKNDVTFRCEDINECEDDIQACPKSEQCVNEEGGYKCVKSNLSNSQQGKNINPFVTPKAPTCPVGYKYNITNNACDDVNECQLRLDNCSPMHRCDNTIGSFYCTRTVSCGTGYTLNSKLDLCEDDDECVLGTHKCYDLGPNYKCKNQMGTYRCELVRPTYRPPPTSSTSTTTSTTTTTTTAPLAKASPNPTTIPTTTATRPPIPITNVWGEPFYSFNRRWPYQTPARPFFTPRHSTTPTTPKVSLPTLLPFNPYTNSPYVPFPTTPVRNQLPIINGMLKKCLPGYKMNERGDCEDINECDSNPCPRGLKCLNFNGRYECSSPLQCKIGYELNEAGDECIDVNECSRGTHKCNKSQLCKNGQGYYTCECPSGHHLNRLSQMCEDIDECKFYRRCGTNSDCINTIGSYQCICKSGFRKNESYCDDINECQENDGLCEQNCVNLWGSYRCACKAGFTLSIDNRTCSDIDECEKFKDRKPCIGICKNVPGSYVCECPPGYKLANDKRGCLDIDECTQNICGPNDACVNTRGGYKCYPITCSNYYVKDTNYKSRCKRLSCDPRDNQCLLMPEQYSFQYMALASNLPLSEGGIPLFKFKGPDWSAAKAEFSLKLLETQCPPGVKKVDDSYIRKLHHQNNQMELNLVKSIQGPQEVKLQVEMKLFQGGHLLGSIVVYIIIIVSEFPF